MKTPGGTTKEFSMGLGVLGAFLGAAVGGGLFAFFEWADVRFPWTGTITGALAGYGARALARERHNPGLHSGRDCIGLHYRRFLFDVRGIASFGNHFRRCLRLFRVQDRIGLETARNERTDTGSWNAAALPMTCISSSGLFPFSFFGFSPSLQAKQ